jgi:DNA helicase-2/ATP-dependent DNA helicase PcrA
MPIILDDLIADIQNETTSTNTTYTPKLFHRELNGQGKKGGRINKDVHPANIDHSFMPDLSITLPAKPHTEKGEEVRYIPTHPILANTYLKTIESAYTTAGYRAAYPQTYAPTDDYPMLPAINTPQGDINDLKLFFVDDALNDSIPGYTLLADFDPQRIILKSTKTVHDDGTSTTQRSTHVYYKITIFAIHDDDIDIDDTTDDPVATIIPDEVVVSDNLFTHDPLKYVSKKSFAVIGYTLDPLDLLKNKVVEITDLISNHNSGTYIRTSPVHIDEDVFFDYGYNTYSLYDKLCQQAEIFATQKIGDINVELFDRMFKDVEAFCDINDYDMHVADFADIIRQLRYLEHFPDIPLDAYAEMFTAINAFSNQEIAQMLLKQNMQLSLNGNLNNLEAVKPVLPRPLDPTNPVSTYPLDPKFSRQQEAAITSNEPCVMVPSGAGTGKSSVIVERMKFLNHHGVPYQNIAAWSFTNAAADNLTARFPDIASSTIASAYMDTYELNFPTHKLSTLDTMITSLEIYYGDTLIADDFLSKFRSLIDNAREGSNATMTALANFVQANLVAVISVLNTIKQTTLELALIISYVMIDDPAYTHKGTSPEYLIIDEVQDNSIFEFVYALKFATYHKASLFIVGDASQTLYEFRAANPKALNALEMSGVFESYPLTTNYRSNQEILDFANKHLIDIDANQFSKIQLQANLLEQPTKDSFTSKVRMKIVHETTQRDFAEAIGRYMAESDVKDFIDEKLAAGEKICVLSPTRFGANNAREALEKMYPGRQVGNLTSELAYNNTIFSQFVAGYWDTVEAVDPANASFTFVQEVMKNLRMFTKNPIKAEKPTRMLLSKWWKENQYNHDNAWLPKYNWVISQPQSTADDIAAAREEFFTTLRESILNFEIANNAVNQSMKAMRNDERKKVNTDPNVQLLVSTIHGTKGLEFDNTIVLYNPKETPDEAHKRMYYVAFTRAKKAEIIIAAASKTMPKIVTDYEMLVEALDQRDKKMAQLIANPHLQAGLSATNTTIDDIDIDKMTQMLADNGCDVDPDTVYAGLIFADDDDNLIEADADTVAASNAAREKVQNDQHVDMASVITAAFDEAQGNDDTQTSSNIQFEPASVDENESTSEKTQGFAPSPAVFELPENTTGNNNSNNEGDNE